MLQIGIHYVDVLEYLMGPVRRVSGQSARLVLPGDNPDVGNMILEHESGAISNLTASYASASEYYMMNIYGKTASAYYDLFGGLRHLKQGDAAPTAIAFAKNDAIREEMDEFAHCVRSGTKPKPTAGGPLATSPWSRPASALPAKAAPSRSPRF